MSNRLKEILDANKRYIDSSPNLKDVKPFPKKEIAIVTCMDVRLDPLKFAGLDIGDANIIRNAGGRISDDAIRSLIVCYKFLGAKEFFVIMHTNCGMQAVDNATIVNLLSESLDKAEYDGNKWKNLKTGIGSQEGKNIDWMTIKDLKQTLVYDVKKLRSNPLIPQYIKINGLVIDAESGKLSEVISL